MDSERDGVQVKEKKIEHRAITSPSICLVNYYKSAHLPSANQSTGTHTHTVSGAHLALLDGLIACSYGSAGIFNE